MLNPKFKARKFSVSKLEPRRRGSQVWQTDGRTDRHNSL